MQTHLMVGNENLKNYFWRLIEASNFPPNYQEEKINQSHENKQQQGFTRSLGHRSVKWWFSKTQLIKCFPLRVPRDETLWAPSVYIFRPSYWWKFVERKFIAHNFLLVYETSDRVNLGRVNKSPNRVKMKITAFCWLILIMAI